MKQCETRKFDNVKTKTNQEICGFIHSQLVCHQIYLPYNLEVNTKAHLLINSKQKYSIYTHYKVYA